MFTEKPLREFVDQLASESHVPGGGSAAALAGAAGAALLSMVANLTIGREKFREVDAEMRKALANSEKIRAEMLELLESDTRAYSGVIAAYRMPRATSDEKRARSEAIQEALKAACEVPMDVARAAASILVLGPDVASKGNSSAVSDVGVGVSLAIAALESAKLNVDINLASISDEAYAAECRQEMALLTSTSSTLRDEVMQIVAKRIAR